MNHLHLPNKKLPLAGVERSEKTLEALQNWGDPEFGPKVPGTEVVLKLPPRPHVHPVLRARTQWPPHADR